MYAYAKSQFFTGKFHTVMTKFTLVIMKEVRVLHAHMTYTLHSIALGTGLLERAGT